MSYHPQFWAGQHAMDLDWIVRVMVINRMCGPLASSDCG